jgi:uncharacterized protein
MGDVMKNLKIAEGLSLPLDVVTNTIAVLAKRRAGKSFLLRRLVEQLYRAGQQVVVVDPKGDWWGIRSAADGKAPGLPVVIAGGERADVPLEPTSGEVVAKLVVEDRVSALIDLSLLRKHEVATFMTGFLEALYRLKAREQFRTPMLLAVDEADAVAPQRPMKGEERMLGAAEDIVRRGGQRGIGCAMATQRAAVLNKNVLTQAQVLIALRTIAPQDLAAIDAWIDVHGTAEQRRELMESLPALPVGDAWVWSPGWPTVDGIFDRVHVLPIETFDSGSTPKPGEKRIEPRSIADVDLDALRRQMNETIERARASDPKELQRKVAELTRELQRPHAEPASPPARDIEREIARVKREAREEWERLLRERDDTIRALQAERVRIGRAIEKAHAAHEEIGALLGKEMPKLTAVPAADSTPATSLPPPREMHVIRRAAVRPALAFTTSGNGSLGGPEQKILNELAEMQMIGVSPIDKAQLALLAGYTNPRSGGFSEPLSRLVAAGLVRYPRGGEVEITDAGRAASVTTGGPRTTDELQERLLAKLDGPRQKILRALIERYPNSIAKEDLGRQLGYSNPRSGGFSEPLGSLRALGLIDYPKGGYIVAQPVLFLEDRR